MRKVLAAWACFCVLGSWGWTNDCVTSVRSYPNVVHNAPFDVPADGIDGGVGQWATFRNDVWWLWGACSQKATLLWMPIEGTLSTTDGPLTRKLTFDQGCLLARMRVSSHDLTGQLTLVSCFADGTPTGETFGPVDVTSAACDEIVTGWVIPAPMVKVTFTKGSNLGIESLTLCCPGSCRVTAGGVDVNTLADAGSGRDRYQFGGQAGAPTGSQPQPFGEWTHHQQRGPDGDFTFHGGTASAPPGTEIRQISCSDPENCVPARTAPFKQIDFAGVGTFKNVKNPPASFGNVVVGQSFHWFDVHMEDLGEPGKAGKIDPPAADCPPGGSPNALANCACPDFYHIRIFQAFNPQTQLPNKTTVIYEVLGYIDGGNIQIHPAL